MHIHTHIHLHTHVRMHKAPSAGQLRTISVIHQWPRGRLQKKKKIIGPADVRQTLGLNELLAPQTIIGHSAQIGSERKTLQKARRNMMSRGSEGQRNGKSVRPLRTIVCQSTAVDDGNDAQGRDHGMNARRHVPRDEAHVLSGRPRLTTSTRCSRPLSNVPFL